MKNKLISTIGLLTIAYSMGAQAADMSRTRPLDGYVCKMLNLTEEQAMSPKPQVYVKAEPSASAPNVGWAPLTVAVKVPMRPQNGFVEMLNLSGRTVWIQQEAITDWHSRSNPAARCAPAVMPNGRFGFTYTH